MAIESRIIPIKLTKAKENILVCKCFEEAFFNVFSITANDSYELVREAVRYSADAPVVAIDIIIHGIQYNNVEFKLVRGDEPAAFVNESLLPAGDPIDGTYINEENISVVEESVQELEQDADDIKRSKIAESLQTIQFELQEQIDSALQESRENAHLAIEAAKNVTKAFNKALRSIEQQTKRLHNERLKGMEDQIGKVLQANLDQLDVIAEEKDNAVKTSMSNFKRELIAEIQRQVQSAQQHLQQKMATFIESYGGGGSVAVQLENGGVINGSLDIRGQILSGGIDVASLITSSGGYQTLNYNISTCDLTISPFGNVISLSSLKTAGGGSDVSSLSSNWQNTYSTVYSNSANWEGTYITSSLWNSSYTTVNSSSANWNDAFTTVKANSANWNNASVLINNGKNTWDSSYTTVNSSSAIWNSAYTTLNLLSSNIGSGTVTSVGLSGAGGIEVVSGSPITTSGTIQLSVNAVLIKSALNLAGSNTGDVTLAGVPTYLTINDQVITRNPINLAGDVTGILPILNGGTGQATLTAAFNSLAPGTTKGDLIVHNGITETRLPVGATNGHVLTVDSATAEGVKWSAGGGGSSGGNWVLISTTTIAGNPTNLDFSFTGSYRKYLLQLENVRQLTPANYIFRLQTSADGGVTFEGGTNTYGYGYGSVGTYAPVSTRGSYIQMTGDSVVGQANVGVHAEIEFFNPLDTASRKFCRWDFWGRGWSAIWCNRILGAGMRDSDAKVDAVRLFLNSGTFTAGTIRLFGWTE